MEILAELDGAAVVRATAEHIPTIERLLADPAAPRTADIGGKATTEELGRAIAAEI